MIQVQNLVKKYMDRTVLRQLSFNIEKGEVVGFLGPNGAGKTTTMRILAGCLGPTSGEVKINGKNILDAPIETKTKVGYLPETPPVYGDMKVESYLKYIGRLKMCTSLQESVSYAMEKAGLKEVRHRWIQNLSKGYQQRVGIAQALLGNPDVLIFDEPTVGLDPSQVIEIRELIGNLKHRHTVLLSSHILSEVEANCEKVIIINNGEIAVSGKLSDLKRKLHLKNLRVRVQKPSSQLVSELQKLEGVKDVSQVQSNAYEVTMSQDVHDQVAKVVVDSKAGLMELKEDEFMLEDVFINITRRRDKGEPS